MSNTKYIQMEQILERIRREFGFEDVYADDVREWIWDVIGIIGSPSLLFDKITDITITNHRGELPIDVFSLMDHIVRDKSSKRVLKKSANLFFEDDSVNAQKTRAFLDAEGYEGVYDLDDDRNMTKEELDGTEYFSVIAPEYDEAGYFYNIKENYIFSNKKEATLELKYTSFPIDDRGFPLVPDDPKVIRAVVWFIGERIGFKYMLQDKLSERKYKMIEQDYLFNVAAARSKADTLDIPDVHNFKHRVLQVVKQNDAFLKGFK